MQKQGPYHRLRALETELLESRELSLLAPEEGEVFGCGHAVTRGGALQGPTYTRGTRCSPLRATA